MVNLFMGKYDANLYQTEMSPFTSGGLLDQHQDLLTENILEITFSCMLESRFSDTEHKKQAVFLLQFNLPVHSIVVSFLSRNKVLVTLYFQEN